MDRRTILLAEKPESVDKLNPTIQKLMLPAEAVLHCGHASLSWNDLAKRLEGVELFCVESMSILASITGKTEDWHKVWDRLEPLIEQGLTVNFINEGVELSKEDEAVYRAMKGVSEAVRQQRLLRQRKGVKHMSETYGSENPMGWIQPTPEKLKELADQVEKHGVTAGCKNMGISKTTYYKWKKAKKL